MAITNEDAAHVLRRAQTPGHTHDENELRVAGFWIFLSTDMILFACLFATYIVLRGNTDGGPGPHQLFDVTGFTEETFILLTSSFTCGLATHAMHEGRRGGLVTWLSITALLGLAFVGLEVSEFVRDVSVGATMQRSAFLSAFFTLVGTHGCHVTLGVFWMGSIMYQVLKRGISATTARKLTIVGLYWHFLDVVWVFLFTVVYLMGVM